MSELKKSSSPSPFDRESVHHHGPTYIGDISAQGIFGNLPEMRKDPIGLLSRAAEKGDLTKLKLLGPTFLVNHPDLVAHVLVANSRNYKRPPTADRLKPLIGNGLLLSSGDFWRRQRRIMQPAFHHSRMPLYAAVMHDEATTMINRWCDHRDGDLVDVHRDMTHLALRIISRLTCGIRLDQESAAVTDALTDALHVTNDRVHRLLYLPWLPTPSNRRFNNAMHTLNGIVSRIIDDRRRNPKGPNDDLLGMLMEARDEETKETMTDQQLHDEIMTMLLAGHETTASSMSFAFSLLAQHRDIERLTIDECRWLDSETILRSGQLDRIPWVNRVFKETIRLYPAAWIVGRSPIEDDEIAGVPIPKKSVVLISPYLLHRRRDSFPDPERFDPLRFALGPKEHPGGSRNAYIPFGAGPHRCIGNGIASMEGPIVLAAAYRRLRFEATTDSIEVDPQITLRPKGGCKMRIRSL